MASTALFKAVTSGRPKQVRLLLQLGADVNCQDDLGQTPLIRALQVKDPRVRISLLKVLLGAGAMVSQPDLYGRNVVMWACRNGTLDDVALLLEEAEVELDLNARDFRGQTALWGAADVGNADIVRAVADRLSQQHQSLDVGDYQGVTPAMRAAMRGHVDCLNILLGEEGPEADDLTSDPPRPSISRKSSSERRNMVQLAETINQGNQMQENEPGRLTSPNRAQEPPVIRIISACGQKVMTVPQTPRQESPDQSSRPDLLRASSRASSRLSRDRRSPSTPMLSPERPSFSRSSSVVTPGLSATPTPVPPDSRRPSLSSRSVRSHRISSVSTDLSWTPEDHQEHWETFSSVSALGDDARSSVSDLRQAGIFPSLPDHPTYSERNRKLGAGLIPPDMSVRASLPILFEISTMQATASYRPNVVPTKTMSGRKTLRCLQQIREMAAENARIEAERQKRLQAERQKKKGSTWSKLRGTLLVTSRLSKGSFKKMMSPARLLGAGASPSSAITSR